MVALIKGCQYCLTLQFQSPPKRRPPPSLSSWVTPPPLFLLNMQSGWRSRSSASTPPTSTTSTTISTTTSPTTAQYAEWRATAGRCRSIQIKPDLSLPRKFPPNSFQQNSRIQNKTQNTRKSTNQIRFLRLSFEYHHWHCHMFHQMNFSKLRLT